MSKFDHVIAHLFRVGLSVLMCLSGSVSVATGQSTDARGSRNVAVVGRFQPGSSTAVSGKLGNVVVDQDENRPFVYATQSGAPAGVVAFDISDPAHPAPVFNSDWPRDGSSSATDVTYFQIEGRTYLVAGAQSASGSDAIQNAAVIFDVSDLYSGTAPEVARLRAMGGLQNLFAYRHSGGQTLLFATGGGNVWVYDLERVLGGALDPISELAIPEEVPNVDYGFHSVFAAYHAETETDRLYTGAAGGYFVYNVSDLANPALLASVNSAAVQIGHAVVPTPDGRMVVTTTGYPTAPIRIFDLEPALDGTIPRVRTAVGAWVADWKNFAEHFAVRWPFVFVASMQDGFQAFNMMFPIDPYTVGFYATSDAPEFRGSRSNVERVGAWDIDVRNHDGLIVLTDVESGLWLFRMDAFEGWDGRGWGLPNISSAQDWKNGPRDALNWPILDE